MNKIPDEFGPYYFITSVLLWAMLLLQSAAVVMIALLGCLQRSLFKQVVDGILDLNKAASVVLFALLGFPLAISYSVPFSVTAELTADLEEVKMIVALGAGPWDALFGGGQRHMPSQTFSNGVQLSSYPIFWRN